MRVRIDCPELCWRYTARVIRGVRVGPSPDWLTKRLATIGIAAINNVVDVSNYVMMECGQPLHTFDYAKLAAPEKVTATVWRSTPKGRSGKRWLAPFPGPKSSSARRWPGRRSRPSTTKPIASTRTCADCRCPLGGGNRRRDGRGGDGSHGSHPQRAHRGGRFRSDLRPHHGPARACTAISLDFFNRRAIGLGWRELQG